MKRSILLVGATLGFLMVGTAQASAACNGLTATITGTTAAETITGTSGADVIEALAGNDTIIGAGGNDTICGGDGYDTLRGGLGNDWMDGQAGADIVDYASIGSAVTINLGTGTASSSTDGTDTLYGTEDAQGSAYADTITGASFNNALYGLGGNDTITAMAGADWVQGGDGDDTINAGTENDNVRGENGTDTLTFSDAAAAITVNLTTTTAQTTGQGSDTILTFENIIGSAYNDTFTGTTTANVIDAHAGADTVNGGDGPDTLTGGTGADILHGELGDDTLHLNEGETDSATSSTCGAGTLDVANADTADTISTDCETINRPDTTGPAAPAVSNITTNTRIDGVAVLSWTAATDPSGIARYEIKLWLDGQAEPADSTFRTTGSSAGYANVRLGVNPTTNPWDWKFKVRAVDTLGNVGAASGAALLDNAYNQVSGTNGDQSMTDVSGLGLRAGHATGNLSSSQSEVSTKGYGVDLVVDRVYNHQNIQLQPVIGDTGWNNSPGPADTESYTSQWAFGFHMNASWEQRLVSGDDGTDDGHAEALTFIDETGTNWPFTPTATSATTYASPAGMDDFDLVKNPSSAGYPTCESGGVDSTWALRATDGFTRCFDVKGRLLRQTMRNGRSLTYTRNIYGRVTDISTDDPDGAGAEQPLKLVVSYNSDKRVSKISDQLGREIRYEYVDYSGMWYLQKVERYASSGSSTALTRTDYAWDANANGRRIIDVDEWIYADDPATATTGDALKHHWDITYAANNQVSTVSETGTASRNIGNATPTKESVPAVPDTLTTMSYLALTSGGSAATLQLDVKTGTAVDDDAFGVWTHTLDSLGRSLVVQKPLESGASTRAQTSTAYTADGRVASHTSERGDVTTYTYDTSGNPTQSTVDAATSDVPDQITTFADYTALGGAQTEVAVRSPDGSFLAKWPYVLNECVDAGASGTFKVTTAGTSGSTAPTWPTSGAVTSGTVTFDKQTCAPTRQGITTTLEYDSSGNQLERQDALGVRTCTFYTAAGEVDVEYKLNAAECPATPDTSTRIRGTLQDHSYNGKGFRTQTTTDESTTRFTFDDAGQMTDKRLVVNASDSTKDVVITTIFDGAGRSTRETRTDADGSTRSTSTTHNLKGQATSRTVPNATYPSGLDGTGSPAGDVTTTQFDARGLVYLEVLADNTIVTRRHDGRRRETFVTVPHAQSNASPGGTSLAYFQSGVKQSKTDPFGVTTSYDPAITVPGADERPLKIDSPISGTTTFTYNARGEISTKVTPAGTFTFAYDGNGNKVKTVYPGGDILVEVHDRQGNVVERRFTPNGGITSVTSLAYTVDGKLDTENQDGGIDSDNTYVTGTGQLESTLLDDDASTWAQETRFLYDTAGRLDSQTIENGASDLLTDYTYEDKSGRLHKIDQANGIDERSAYDNQGRLTELKALKRSDSSWQGGDTYSYDAQGRITSRIRRISGSSFNTSFTYDPSGQITSEASHYGIVRRYEYRDANNHDAFGTDLNRQTLHVTSAPSGALTLARVDEIEACLTQAASCGATDEAAIDSTIDDIAAPGSLIDPSALTGTAADVARWLKLRDNTQSWSASTAYPVGKCISPNGWQWERYEVTTAGTSGSTEPAWPGTGTVTDGTVTWTKTNCTPVLVLRSYTYDSNTPSKHQLVEMKDRFGTPAAYTYDTRGNQVSRGGVTQAFDGLDRPTTLVNEAGQTVTLSWYRDDYKLKTFQVGSGETRTLKYDNRGRVVLISTTSWTTEYAYDKNGLSAFKNGGVWYGLDRSIRGDVIGVRDGSGVLRAAISYTAYGEQSTDNQALIDKLGMTYNGRDGVVSLGGGLYWMGHRTYGSRTGAFVSADPLEAKTGSLQSPYRYTDNNPVSRTDPSGLAWYWDSWDRTWRWGNGCSYSWDYGYYLNIYYRDAFVSYRGPCANHDMCYSGYWYTSLGRYTCDSYLLRDGIFFKCEQYLGRGAPGLATCRGWATTMYNAVRNYARGFYHGPNNPY